MLHKLLASMGAPALAAAALLWSTGLSSAQHHSGGGGHPGGGATVHPGGGGVSHGAWSGGGNTWRGGDFNRGHEHGRGFDRGGVFFGFGYPWYGGYDYYPNYGSYGSYYNPDYTYSQPYYYTQPSYSSDYYYGAAPAASATDPNAAIVDVTVPDPNAQIWINGSQTQQRGTMREFESPALTPGKDYTYEIRAQWTQNGQSVTQTRDVDVRAGEHRKVTFPTTQNTGTPAATPGQ